MASPIPNPRIASSDPAVETRLAAPRFTASPEFDLLRRCAVVNLTPEHENDISEANMAAIDWAEFFRIADHHGLVPLAARNLLAYASDLPEHARQSLNSAYEVNVRRNLWFAGELARIGQHFEKRKVRALSYKGPLLAEFAYGDLALRSFSDLDFLVSHEDFGPATMALAELGYEPSKPVRPEIQPLWLKFGYECAFDGKAGKYLVELQWKLLPSFYAVDLDIDALLDRSIEASVSGFKVKTLSPEDLLLVLCLHAAKHLWMRLIWVADIAETIRSQQINYDVVISHARELGIARILALSFWLVKNVLEATLPPAAEELIDSDSAVPAVGHAYADRLRRSASYDFESSEYFRLIGSLRENRADRCRYLWRLLWTPGESDLTAIRLPRSLFPFYRVVRLGRLLLKAIQKLSP